MRRKATWGGSADANNFRRQAHLVHPWAGRQRQGSLLTLSSRLLARLLLQRWSGAAGGNASTQGYSRELCAAADVHKQDPAQHPGQSNRHGLHAGGGRTEATSALYGTNAPGAATRRLAAARRGSAARTLAPAVQVDMAVSVRIYLGQGVNKRLLATEGSEEQRRWGGPVQG